MDGYHVVLEGDDETGYSAFTLDLPGIVVAAGDTRDECIAEMQTAIAFHIESLRSDGEVVPPPSTTPATIVSVQPAA